LNKKVLPPLAQIKVSILISVEHFSSLTSKSPIVSHQRLDVHLSIGYDNLLSYI